nr:retrovirus-related Pol polyprotein from transposon TNT 1-94 [Tanacetum cinerariifolium]
MIEKKVITKPIDYAILNQLSTDFNTRFVPQTESYAEQAFWSQYSMQTDEPTHFGTTIVEVPKELPKVSMVNSCLKKLKFHLVNFDIVVKERTTATAFTQGTWGFEHTKACFRDDIIPFVKNLKELFTSFDQCLIDEVTKVQKIFKQMELAVEQHCAEKTKFQTKMENVLKENDRLLTHALSVAIVNIVVHDCMNVNCLNVDACEHCVTTESELKTDFIKKECYETLLQQYHILETHCISLEVNNKLNTEIFQRDTVSSSKKETLLLAEKSRSKMIEKQNNPKMVEKKVITKLIDYVVLNQLSKDFETRFVPQTELSVEQAFWSRYLVQPKESNLSASTTIVEVPKELPKVSLSLCGDVKERKVKKEIEEIKTVNIELDHRVTKLVAENEHLKQTYKQLLQEKVLVITALKESLSKLKGKYVVNEAVPLHFIDPELLKIDVAPLALKLRKNRTVHTDYIRHTQEEADTLREIVERRTFTLLGNVCPLTRLATTTIVPPKEPIPIASNTDKPVITLKFLGTVKFENDHVAKIMGYGDYQIGNVTISRVYYVEGLGHNLVSVGQFCDSDLDVAFRQHTCFIRNLDGVDMLTGSQEKNLYTLSLQDMMASTPICLLSNASKTKSWLWHRRLSHLNFGTINHLARQGLVRGLLKLKFKKDHLCSTCAMGKSMKKSHKPKPEDTNQEKLYLLHMDLCRSMRVESVKGKKYIIVIVDDYSRFTWVKFLRSKDETPDFIIKFLRMIQVQLKVPVRQAVATAYFTQNRSIIRLRHGKTPYELLHNKLPDLSFFYVFAALCYPTNDSGNLGKLQPKADIRIFIGYTPTKKAFRIYNRRTRRIVETIHVDFDELTTMASEQSSSGPALNETTPATFSSRLVQKSSSSTPYVPPSRNDWDFLFQPMFDELLNPPPSVDHQAAQVIAPIA